jgi:Trk K+ transport system NAD-binding subunit
VRVSILVVGAEGDVGAALVSTLVDQGDEVRVVEDNGEAGLRWRSMGAYVAAGAASDPDFVERAAQGVQTVVVFGDRAAGDVAAILPAVTAAFVERIVWYGDRATAQTSLEACGLDYVLIHPPSGFRLRRRIAPEAVVRAIDAADGLPGRPRLTLELGSAEARAVLG